MDTATYQKIIVEDKDFPIVVLENNKFDIGQRQQLCPLHWHEHLELHYISEGRLEIEVDQTPHILNKGDLIVIHGNDPHRSCCSGRLKELILIFQLEDLSQNLAQLVPGFQQVIRQDPFVGSAMATIDREYTQKELGYDVACKGHLLQLTAYLARNYIRSANPECRRHKKQLRRLLPVQEYIAAHLSEPLDSETLAALVYLSKDRFNHLFKECIGIPPRRYINDVRLHTVKGWLENGVCTPTEAAQKAGFTDYNYFGRLFRQTFGCTPSQVQSRKTAK